MPTPARAPLLRTTLALALTLTLSPAARAHDDEPADRAPVLSSFVEPAYPRDSGPHSGGVVTLRLQITAQGTVSAAVVEQALAPSFDQAAVSAARRLVFQPALVKGKAAPTEVRFEYRFLPPGHTHTRPVQAPELIVDAVSDLRLTDTAVPERPPLAASARTVRDSDLRARRIDRPADLLRVTPGLVVVQHAGGGKASQYFLRGFDADHGTDVAFSVDGIPVNMVSHGHGQGYADPGFIIPELVERMEITKGPHGLEGGDFASAGAVELSTRESGESFLSLGGGSWGQLRAVGMVAPDLGGPMQPLLAGELVRSDGPFEHPERYRKHNLHGKLTGDLGPRSNLSLAASTSAASWNASGQLPARAVDSGAVGFYGALDPTEGGATSRHNLSASFRLRPTVDDELTASAYLSFHDFTLYSNFTFLADDPVNGDQIEQRDSRVVSGARARYRWVSERAGVRWTSTLGGSARQDNIDNALLRSRARERLARVVDAEIRQSSLGLFAGEEAQLSSWLRVHAGLRVDQVSFAVQDRLEDLAAQGNATSGIRSATQLSPRAGAVFSPVGAVELFLNYGHGFHSNDARGVVRAAGPVDPLTRSVGYELGLRTRLADRRLELGLAAWGLDLESETLWVGDAGTTESSGATRRVGLDLDARLAIRPWLLADLDVTLARARFRQDAGNGQAVPLAPRMTITAGLSALHPRGLRGSLRLLHVSQRPATEDGFLKAEGFTLLDLSAAWRWRAFELGLGLENLLDRRYRAAQFATVTRLAGEPGTSAPPPPGACPAGTRAAIDEAAGNFRGCEDLSFSPGNPFGIRVSGTFYF